MELLVILLELITELSVFSASFKLKKNDCHDIQYSLVLDYKGIA